MSEETKRTLVKKLAEIMGEVERVPKNGRNSSQGYNYATEADIAAAVRAGMARRSLVMFPSVEKTEWSHVATRNGGTLRLCSEHVRFTLEDGESGETRSFVMVGEGTDSGDKASYKAVTGAEKYALMKLFLIPTGDDPEKDSKDEPTEGERVAAEPSPKPRDLEAEARQQIWGAKDAEGAGPLVPFGKKHKGKPMAQLSAEELDWYIGALKKSIEDPEKANFKAKNKRDLADFERVRRQKFQEEPAYGSGSPNRADHSHD